MSNLLEENGVKFDIKNKILIVDGSIINIDYDKFRGRLELSHEEKYIKKVARKIYNDSQINAFFSIDDIASYGTDIHQRPEFLINLSNLVPGIKKVEKIWRNKSKGYIVSFLAKFDQFAWPTFYNNEYEYMDYEKSRLELKKWLINKSVCRSIYNSGSKIGVRRFYRSAF